MSTTGQNTSFDVIVIGAGIAGLVSAAKLQRGGKRVLLLEQHDKVGGYCTNWQRQGYVFTPIHFVAGCEPGGALHTILRDCGAQDRVGFVKLEPNICKLILPDRQLQLPSNLGAFTAMLAEQFPQENGVAGYFAALERIYDFVDTIGSKDLSAVHKTLLTLANLRGMWGFGRYLNAPLAKLLDKHIADPQVRHIVSQLWGLLGAPPSRLSLLFFVMAFMGYYKTGAYHIEGGAQRLSDALAASFRDHGGELQTGADAIKITVEQGAATGVVVRDAEGKTRSYAARTVVSAADATHTFRELVGEEHLPAPFMADLTALRPAISVFAVYLGVDMELPPQVAEDFEIIVSSSTTDADAVFLRMLRRERFDDFAITFYSNIDPSMSPAPGRKHSISLLSIMSLNEETLEQDWDASSIEQRGEAYRARKRRYAEQLIDSAERHVPGLRDGIEVMSIATPLTMKRYTRNRNGSILGWDNTTEQSMMRRLEQRTPIGNLFLAGAWTFPGGGINGASLSGATLAEQILAAR